MIESPHPELLQEIDQQLKLKSSIDLLSEDDHGCMTSHASLQLNIRRTTITKTNSKREKIVLERVVIPR
jgi:hypothetical protein